MVVTIKFNELTEQNLRILAGYMINIETGIEYYNHRGIFTETTKPFNEYSYKDVKFTFKPVFGKIIYIGRRSVDVYLLNNIIKEMINPGAAAHFVPVGRFSSQHILIEKKMGIDGDSDACPASYRCIYKYKQNNTTDYRTLIKTIYVHTWEVNEISPTSAWKKLTKSVDFISTDYELNMSPSTIIVDCVNGTTVPFGYKTINSLRVDQFHFHKRFCRKRLGYFDFLKIYAKITNTVHTSVSKPSMYIKWSDVKLVKPKKNMPLEKHLLIMDYKTQLLINDEPEELLNCYKCRNPVFDECDVVVMNADFHIICHSYCLSNKGKRYRTKCPQTFIDILRTIKVDDNTKDLLEGIYLNGLLSIRIKIFVVNHKKKKIFYHLRKMDEMLLLNSQLYGFLL